MTKIVQITDTHLFAEAHGRLGEVDVDASLTAVLAAVRRDHGDAELVLASGDLAQEEVAASYTRLDEHLAALPAPVYCLPGNHEDKALLAEQCARGRLRCDRRILVPGWQLVLLDSARPPEPGGHLEAEELTFLEACLAEHPDRAALVVLHHPPVSVNSPWMDAMRVDNAPALLEVLDRHPAVRAVVFGHVHQQFETVRNGVRYLASPSTCLQFRPGAAVSSYDDRPPGFRWLRLGADGGLETAVERVAMG
ncbi:3',5'-cyclic-AMP phosphodiesterase [Thiohalorhabdus methylotrophus]|uniref:3',5'-cyclic-AMP phosphodiesterase n=1 Tax=Thiohalorhabdus methylotrophus TaxID=3242694 RepID=A0ABV4TR33_9GAMM